MAGLARPGGVEQRLVTRRGSELARRARAPGVVVREVPWDLSLDPRALWRLARETGSFAPRIVHAHDSHALQLAFWARRLSRLAPPPRLVATRRVDFHLRRGRVWFRADHLIAISETVRAVLVADGVPLERISVVPSGVDPEEIRRAAERPLDVRRRLGLAPETPLAVNAAALVGLKDQRTLIHAAHAARSMRPALHWVIAGEGELRGPLEAEAARLGIADRVHLIGHVVQVDALIREADVFVMSSRQEGLGSAVLHALALGTPVVATRGGGLAEIVPERWLVPIGDAAALARTVIEALDRPSPTPLAERFTAAAMTRGVLAVYQSLA